MPRKTSLSRKVAKAIQFCKSMGMLVPPGDIQFLHATALGDRVYAIRSPLTHEWMEFSVSQQLYHSKCIPTAAHALTDYYSEIVSMLETARDYAPMNHDLSSHSEEESRVFGIKINPRISPPKRRNFTSSAWDGY